MPVRRGWNARVSTAAQAESALTAHVFRPGLGYTEFAPHLALKHGPVRGGNCKPAKDAPPRSEHRLKPPGGHAALVCAWVPAEQAWRPLHRDGKRMAFTADYLASHGWTYLAPVASKKSKAA